MSKYVVGEAFNPWREKCGFFPPAVVGRLKNLGDGPKRAYERLVLYAGQNGSCYPAIDTLADELGKSRSQVIRDMKALQDFKLLDVKKRDGRRSNTYLFLWHSCFEVSHMEPQTDSREEFEVSSVQPQSEFEVPYMQPQNSGRSSISEDLKFHMCKFEVPHMTPKRFRKDSGKIQFDSIEESTGLETASTSTSEESENPDPDSGGWRKSPELIERLRTGLASIRFPSPSREDRLLGRAPATGENPNRVLPDDELLAKVLGKFRNAADVDDYLATWTIRDRPVVKSYGFFLTDVARQARSQRSGEPSSQVVAPSEPQPRKTIPHCGKCDSKGFYRLERESTTSDISWCDCEHATALRAQEPWYVEGINTVNRKLRARQAAA